MPPVYMNGSLLPEEEAVISVFDHGLITGDGVFESVVIREGKLFALTRHLERLQRSAEVISLSVPPAEELARAAAQVVDAAAITYGKLRITVTGGRGTLGSRRSRSSPTVVIAAETLETPDGHDTVLVAPWPRNERSALAGAKTLSYGENVVALQWARQRGASEALLLNCAGNLCEGTGSNVFVVLGGSLLTPPLSAGCLAGVTRGLVLEVTGACEADVEGGALADVSEAFLTSTTRGVRAVSSIEGRTLAACPGPITKGALSAFASLSERQEL
jgi:branched-chain amino acid aminotransferase